MRQTLLFGNCSDDASLGVRTDFSIAAKYLQRRCGNDAASSTKGENGIKENSTENQLTSKSGARIQQFQWNEGGSAPT
jgi:hypothetical protein